MVDQENEVRNWAEMREKSGEEERPLRGRRVGVSVLRMARWEMSMEEAMALPRLLEEDDHE